MPIFVEKHTLFYSINLTQEFENVSLALDRWSLAWLDLWRKANYSAKKFSHCTVSPQYIRYRRRETNGRRRRQTTTVP